MNEPIGLGILGGGMISQIAHLPFYLDDPRCRVVAVAETRPSLVAHLQKMGLKVVADHRHLLEDRSINAVVVSAPRPAMGPLTLEALVAGKHVMAEKPMAHTADQATRLVEAARARDLVYAVGFMKRCDPGVAAARGTLHDAIKSGRLGRLLSARFYDHSRSYAVPPPPHQRPEESRKQRFPEWPLWPSWVREDRKETYAWFMNSASHDVNLLHFFFSGDVDLVSADSPNDSAVTALFRCGDVPVSLDVSKTAAGRWLEGAEFVFETGRIGVTIPSPMATDLVAEVALDDPQAGKRDTKLETDTGWCFERQAHGFVDALLGIASPAASGADGLADLQLIERIWSHISDHG